MIKEHLAFADLEEFGLEFDNKLKSSKLKNKTTYSKITDPAMKLKLADEQMSRRELVKVRTNMKKGLAEKYQGDKSRGFKRAVNYLRQEARKVKLELQEKYKMKVEHLKNKYRKQAEDLAEEVPEDMSDYADLSVFKQQKYDEIEEEKYEVLTIGEVSLSEEEKQVLRLHNKFSVLENLKFGDLDGEQEASIAKLRMEKVKDQEYEGYTPEERLEDEEITAKGRMIFDPCTKVFDGRKRRVTDLKECTRITLPKPLNPEDEAKIEVRRKTQKEVFEN